MNGGSKVFSGYTYAYRPGRSLPPDLMTLNRGTGLGRAQDPNYTYNGDSSAAVYAEQGKKDLANGTTTQQSLYNIALISGALWLLTRL